MASMMDTSSSHTASYIAASEEARSMATMHDSMPQTMPQISESHLQIAHLNNAGVSQLHQAKNLSLALRHFRNAFEKLKADFATSVGSTAHHDSNQPEAMSHAKFMSLLTSHSNTSTTSDDIADSIVLPHHGSIYAHSFGMPADSSLLVNNDLQDAQIRSAIVIYNLGLILHIQSTREMLPTRQRERQAHLAKAQSLYLHAYRLLHGLLRPQQQQRADGYYDTTAAIVHNPLVDLLNMAVLNNLAHIQQRLPSATTSSAHIESIRFIQTIQSSRQGYSDERTSQLMQRCMDVFLLNAATRDLESSIAAAAA